MHEDDSSEKKEPAGHDAGAAVDDGAVVRGNESGADVAVAASAVVAATVVAATAADVTSGIAAVVPSTAAAVLMAAVVVAADDVIPGPTVLPDVLLYKSTALDCPTPAVTLMRRQPPAQHTPQRSNKHTSQTSIIRKQQLQHNPSVTQRKSCNYLRNPLRR